MTPTNSTNEVTFHALKTSHNRKGQWSLQGCRRMLERKSVELGNLIPEKLCFWRKILAISRGYLTYMDISVFFLSFSYTNL